MKNFNFWFVAAPVMMAISVLWGVARYGLTKDLRIVRHFRKNDRSLVLRVYSVAAGMIFGSLLILESSYGILQLLDDLLRSFGQSEYAEASIVLYPIVVIGASVIFGYYTYVVGKVSEWARHGFLQVRKEQIRRKRQMEMAYAISNVIDQMTVERRFQEKYITDAEFAAKGESFIYEPKE